MDKIMALANKYNLFVIEDAAQAIDSFYKGKPLGSIGHFGCFSFHETKNIQCGEGGMLAINDDRFFRRAEIIWEKGTNRAEFFRGEVNKYGWVDIGSSFLPSELAAAFLYAQLECLDNIQTKRKTLWNRNFKELEILKAKGISLPSFPDFSTNNAHMFYLVCSSLEQRSKIIEAFRRNNILAVFHYLSLHKSPFYQNKHDGIELLESDRYSDCLLRLPFYNNLDLNNKHISIISKVIADVN
jgi:dTDP-4-amino-4,6-dideoxygalactose transaminase